MLAVEKKIKKKLSGSFPSKVPGAGTVLYGYKVAVPLARRVPAGRKKSAVEKGIFYILVGTVGNRWQRNQTQ